jgi:signal peptidase I
MSEPTYFNRNIPKAVDEPKEETLWDLIKVIIQAVVIAVLLRALLFQPFNIPSGSLIPTLEIGDYVFASKYSYGYSHYSLPGFLDWFPQAMPGRIFFSPPKRSDIAVFRPPGDQLDDFIKRVIGLPGDKIQLKDARLYINGELVDRQPLPPYKTANPFGDMVDVPHYEETLPGGVKHEIIQLNGDKGEYSNTGVYEVPPGHYFMMGDNRDNSSDSRVDTGKGGVVGYVPAENLIARAEIVFFSVDGAPAWQFWRWPWTVRWNRLMHVVR